MNDQLKKVIFIFYYYNLKTLVNNYTIKLCILYLNKKKLLRGAYSKSRVEKAVYTSF